mmetsp:Transcript_57563/g.126148  ORF Transcript_57563/g.126148 Transcript_57563/m.126148 type:complete len:340 (-) Transcript_57563:54-1073(-)
MAKAHSALDEVDAKGGFKRTDAGYRNKVEAGGRFAPEADRYHLYVALGCPWAAGSLSMLLLKGLDKTIGHSIVHPTWRRTRPDDPEDTHCGWNFNNPGDAPVANSKGFGANECDDALIPDTINNCKCIRDLYELTNDTTGKYTTPVLWDKKEKTIVNNESTEILRMFNDCFNDFAEHPEVNLYPEEFQKAAEEINAFVYPTVNNGVYRCGFAQSQEAYEEALEQLFSSLDKLDKILGEKRYTTGPAFTWLDLRLYHTLVRFDPVYHTYFKTNLKKIEDFPNLLGFVRDIYQSHEAVRKTTNMKHIKMTYYTSHPSLNPYGIIPGSNGADLTVPANREKM